ncbi:MULTISPECIES: MFS transporter [Amycolatopsis]|uniref:MFS transporter n=1 Tax=Amycolatopsis echigonensis TaxID=2576905 RepID=A0A8E1VUB8_9PSEU|nr:MULTISPECIES: MFS transporter [Amycolatopsis]MBB2498443.1 MFS transporter [Amycolatopsis echigonensis]
MSANPARISSSPYRWFILFACWFSFTLTSVDRSTWGPASVFVGESLAVPLAGLGVFATAYYVGYVVSNALGGIGTDRFGGRVMLTIALLGAGAFMTVFGSTASAGVGIAVQAVIGLFAGAEYSAGIRLITSWFPPERLGLPMGVYTTATSLGTAVANTVVPALIAWHGWQTSYHFFGAVSMVTAVVLFFLLRKGKEARAAAGRTGPGVGRSALRLFGNRNFLLVCVIGFAGLWGLYGFVTWANALMIRGYHVSPELAGAVVAIFAITAVVVKPVIGFVADKVFRGARKVPVIVLLGAFAAALTVFANLGSATGFLWFAPVLGAVAYGWTPLLVALLPGLVPRAVIGFASGLANAVWQLGAVLVPVVVGAVFAGTRSFEAALFTLALGPLLGLLAMIFMKLPRAGSRASELDPADAGNTKEKGEPWQSATQ